MRLNPQLAGPPANQRRDQAGNTIGWPIEPVPEGSGRAEVDSWLPARRRREQPGQPT